ncbi:hypothetical protein GCM10009868_38040 [Terrabacter aerolatus]|uniref:Uncharacterized protein n=1 Tax=Terrabacter aerolatus TaxID=422442 RepID=A0A512CVI8_9MICO|nr:hypothetical protein [Terrabacter aerolatus]GEO28213.1 hypothetical protein TAE01_00230 [Terrabacter aerolatus]
MDVEGSDDPTSRSDHERASPSLRDAAAPGLPVFLSTEHWSLLGTRSLTWSEVMSRITIHLTVVSAFLVVLALTAQATGFGTPFRVMAIGFASAALLMGVLTAIRVNTASREDVDLIRAMNRLRHAYVELAPELEPYLTASIHDDGAGTMQTYALGRRRNTVLHVAGSTSMFLMVVNAIVAGTLGALVADAAGGGTVVVVTSGVVAALSYAVGHLAVGRRVFGPQRIDVRFPSPGPTGSPASTEPPRSPEPTG